MLRDEKADVVCNGRTEDGEKDESISMMAEEEIAGLLAFARWGVRREV